MGVVVLATLVAVALEEPWRHRLRALAVLGAKWPGSALSEIQPRARETLAGVGCSLQPEHSRCRGAEPRALGKPTGVGYRGQKRGAKL